MAQVAAPPVRTAEREMLEETRRFAALLRTADGSRRPKGMRWTVAEIGAHVAQSAEDAIRVAEGGTSAYAGIGFSAEIDEKLVAALPERDPMRLADMIEIRYDAVAEALRSHADDARIGLVAGLTPGSARAILTIDFLLHGTQVASTLGRTYPLDGETLRTCAAAVLPYLYDAGAARGMTATYSLRFRGARPLVYAIEDGTLVIDDGRARRIDCHVSADPGSFLLQGIGLIPLWKLALTGRMVSWGRKPWLSLKLPKLVPAVPHGGVAA